MATKPATAKTPPARPGPRKLTTGERLDALESIANKFHGPALADAQAAIRASDAVDDSGDTGGAS